MPRLAEQLGRSTQECAAVVDRHLRLEPGAEQSGQPAQRVVGQRLGVEQGRTAGEDVVDLLQFRVGDAEEPFGEVLRVRILRVGGRQVLEAGRRGQVQPDLVDDGRHGAASGEPDAQISVTPRAGPPACCRARRRGAVPSRRDLGRRPGKPPAVGAGARGPALGRVRRWWRRRSRDGCPPGRRRRRGSGASGSPGSVSRVRSARGTGRAVACRRLPLSTSLDGSGPASRRRRGQEGGIRSVRPRHPGRPGARSRPRREGVAWTAGRVRRAHQAARVEPGPSAPAVGDGRASVAGNLHPAAPGSSTTVAAVGRSPGRGPRPGRSRAPAATRLPRIARSLIAAPLLPCPESVVAGAEASKTGSTGQPPCAVPRPAESCQAVAGATSSGAQAAARRHRG